MQNEMPKEIWIRRINNKPTGIELVFGEVDGHMTKYHHDSVVAAKDAEIKRLREVLKRIKLEILDQNGQEFYEDEFPFIEKALTTHAEAIKRAGGE